MGKGKQLPRYYAFACTARLLRTDLNTLLSFQDDLSEAEISSFVDKVDKTAQEKDMTRLFKWQWIKSMTTLRVKA